MKRIVAMGISVALLAGCSWVTPPLDYGEAAYRAGAEAGCLAGVGKVMDGPAPTEQLAELVRLMCAQTAEQLPWPEGGR